MADGLAAVKLKLISDEPTEETHRVARLYHVSRFVWPALWKAAPTEPTERLIAVLKEARETLDYCQAYYNYAGARLSAANVDALLKELE